MSVTGGAGAVGAYGGAYGTMGAVNMGGFDLYNAAARSTQGMNPNGLYTSGNFNMGGLGMMMPNGMLCEFFI
jgi:hypothetical protein